MKHLKLGGACMAIAVLAAMAVATSAHASTQYSSVATAPMLVAPPSLDPRNSAEIAAVVRTGVPLPRAREAIAVQSAFQQAGLIEELEAALGDAYGGAWFSLGAAQLQVGVTSQDAARIAEAVAVRAGLGSHVIEVPVDSSEAELIAVQEQLNHRLADLAVRGEVATQASVKDNAVYVELGSKVPAAELAALESEVSESSVEVVVTRSSRAKLEAELEAQCGEWESKKAYCDPTIVAGTVLEDTIGPWCTTGPVVAQPKGSTELYVLTAGHCFSKAKEKLWSRNKAENKTEVVGEVAAFLRESTKHNVDVAAVKIDNGFWKQAGKIPVVPTIALWEGGKETEPQKVKGEAAPTVETVVCISGMRTSYHCGVIFATKAKYGTLEELVEVEGITTETGDSGGPWFAEGVVQGTHVGKAPTETKYSIYHPLQFSFKRLKEVSGLELELVTEKNETRM